MATPIVISAPRPAASFTPLFVAIDRGFFGEEGLDASIRYQMGVEELLRGEVDFLAGGGATGALREGGSVKLVCGHSTKEASHVLMVRPQFESVAQLSHVLVSRAGSDAGVDELRLLLAARGVSLDESDITPQKVRGSHKEQMVLLKEGIGDAATLGPPWWMFVAKDGWWKVALEEPPNAEGSRSGICVAAEKIAKSPEVVNGFVRALVKAHRYCQEHPEGTIETMMKYSNVWGVETVEIAKDAYAECAPTWNPALDMARVQAAIVRAAEQGGVPPVPVEQYTELRFLQEALSR